MINLSGQPVATGARAILAGSRTPGPFQWRDVRREMDKEQWRAQYRDPQWQKKRLEVLERDEFTCQFCGDTKTMLHVHHMWYVNERKPWEYPLSAFLTLCEPCHELETERLPDLTRYFVHVIKTCGGDSAAFDVLADAFPPAELAPGACFDDWAVLALGIRKLLGEQGRNTECWQILRAEYYADLKERNA